MKKTDITKRAIVDATTQLLRANGNVTIKEISDLAHVNIAAINYHFTDKQTLINVVIKELMDQFRDTVDMFISCKSNDTQILRQNASDFLNSFYDTVFKNLGIIKYIITPSNDEVLTTSGMYFMEMFSLNSNFTQKILDKIGSLCNLDSHGERIKVKYAVIFSALCFPLIFNVKSVGPEDAQKLFMLNDPNVKNLYIDQLISIITSNF